MPGAASHWMDRPPAVEPLRFRRMPLLAGALAFAAGDLLARNHPAVLRVIVTTTLLFALAAFSLRSSPRIAIVPVLAVWVALGCWCTQMEPPIAPQQSLTRFADGLSRTVRGHVVRIRNLTPLAPDDDTPQQPWRREPGAWETSAAAAVQSVDLDVTAVEDVTPDTSTMVPVAGGVRITLQGSPLQLACGDLLEIPLRLRTPEQYRDPGAWSYPDQLLGEGISTTATAKASHPAILATSTGTFRCRLYAAQLWAATRLDTFIASRPNQTLPGFARLRSTDAAMLNAMLFGDRTALNQPLRTGFERTGTFHLFVVSGLHVVLLAGGFYWILRRLRTPEGFAVILTIAAATAYALLTGFGQPVQRALAMTAVYLLARWLGRQTSALNALGAAGLFMLVLDPRALTEPGFQMTFLVILAVAGLATPVGECTFRPWALALRNLPIIRIDASLPPRLAQFRILLRMACEDSAALFGRRAYIVPVWILTAIFRFCDLLLFGIAIEICMVLPMAIYFHRATLLALPVNLIAIPLIATMLCCAIAMFAASLISAWLAAIPAAATAIVLHATRFLVDHTQRNPLADLRVPAPAAAALIAACVLLAFACWALRSPRQRTVRLGLAAALLIPLAALWPAPPLLRPDQLEVTAIDVGQGDSLLVVSPTGHTLLVDSGGPIGIAALTSSANPAAATTRWDVGEEVVAPYLWSRRIRRLDAVLLTHAHSDHMGGMPAILRDFHPRELWLSIEPGNSPGLRALLVEATQLHITVRHFHAGDAFPWQGVQAAVLAPEAPYLNPGAPSNDDSLVIRLAWQQASVLLEGDAESPSEFTMLTNHRVEPSTLLKVGHHGSLTSTNPAFLAAVAPQEAVISVGSHNTFGHPRGEVLARLEAAHIRTFRTDRQGAETFLLSADGRISANSAASN